MALVHRYLLETLAGQRLTRRSTTKMVAAGAFYKPKENLARPLGEDAHFVCASAQTIGVADGVGGWSQIGIDAGEYSRALMSNAEISVRYQVENTGSVNPTRALHDAFCNTVAEGSSTACVLTLVNGSVEAVNVGDSGFVVVRGGAVVYRSPVQQREFNFPYQLGTTCDNPSVAQSLTVGVRLGDVIVMGTDGLFDNVYEKELERLVDEVWFVGGAPPPPGKLARKIAAYAYEKGRSEDADTPFAVEAWRAGRLHVGGKYDDVTVVVAYVEEADQHEGFSRIIS
ncbi:PREDICTED: probable protein phosphatase 2C 55 [Ipomoea nil]|uniref:probable protein phosphatase 2C 55 n=1 Tax=Ipomoea nil TaxID=35883 RepID=UPI000900E80A|nr:PREDICTED: probable protein phosphatase 2C 55 [Ipomoea nil]